MKDTVFTAAGKRRQLRILLACFIAANLINIGAIAAYGTRWVEVFTQIGYVVCITVVLYAAVFVVRWLIAAIFCRRARR